MNYLTLFSPYFYKSELSGEELLVFAIASISMVLVLLTYYQKISKKHPQSTTIDESIPMYAYKDHLLQERNLEIESFPLITNTSMAVKAVAVILILLVITTPLYQLFKFEHFV